jgi:hypothetical protein
VFDERGEAARSDIAEAKGPAWFRLEEWHEYDLVCAGPRLTLKVDARLAAEVVDKDLRRQDFSGVLGLQLHSGGPSVVQFKDICLQTLKAPPAGGRPRPTINPARTAVFREALAYWDLGSGGHGGAKPLTYHGALEHCQLDVLADGLGSRPAARVAQLSGGYFEAGNGLQVGVSELTVYVRARDPRGLWHSAVLAQGGGQDSILFRLSAVEPGSGGEQQFQFETVADRGSANVSFPLSKIDASAWHELVGRYNGHALELLCDRQVMAQKSWEGGRLSTGSASLLLGAAMESGKATHHFHGEIEEAAIWSKWVSVP